MKIGRNIFLKEIQKKKHKQKIGGNLKKKKTLLRNPRKRKQLKETNKTIKGLINGNRTNKENTGQKQLWKLKT